MSWLEQKVLAYERMRFAQEPNRRVLPFAWGLEHVGGSATERDPRGWLENFARDTVAHSDEWFATTPADDYALVDNVLSFTSAIESPWPENNRVHAQLFQARRNGPAVVVLAQWNSRWEEQQNVCRWLNQLGITAVKLSLPYHDRRAIPGHPRADYMVSAEHRPYAAGQSPGGAGYAPHSALARTARLRPPRHSRHQHRLLPRVSHYRARTRLCAPARFCMSPHILVTWLPPGLPLRMCGKLCITKFRSTKCAAIFRRSARIRTSLACTARAKKSSRSADATIPLSPTS